MEPIWILVTVWIAMISASFWEAYAEGPNPWARAMYTWRLRITKRTVLTGYHFFLFGITYPVLIIALPLVVAGFSWELFGILASALFTGYIIEDFFWFVVNPKFSFKAFNADKVDWYPWLRIWKIQIPWGYILGVIIALLFWWFFWK